MRDHHSYVGNLSWWATHLAILYVNCGEFDRKRFSPSIDADTLVDFFANCGDVAILKIHVIKLPNLMG